MFISLVIPLSGSFTTNMREMRCATDNSSGTNLKQIQTNIRTHISCIQLSRQTVKGNNIAEKTTKYQQVTTFKAAVFQTSLSVYIAGKKEHYPIN
jgi:hypothetical protein